MSFLLSDLSYSAGLVRILNPFDIQENNGNLHTTTDDLLLTIEFISCVFKSLKYQGALANLFDKRNLAYLIIKQSTFENIETPRIAYSYKSLIFNITDSSFTNVVSKIESNINWGLFSGGSTFYLTNCYLNNISLINNPLFDLEIYSNFIGNNISITNVSQTGSSGYYLFVSVSDLFKITNSNFDNTTQLLQTSSISVEIDNIRFNMPIIDPKYPYIIQGYSRFPICLIKRINIDSSNQTSFQKMFTGKFKSFHLHDNEFIYSNSIEDEMIKISTKYAYISGNKFINKHSKSNYNLFLLSTAEDIVFHNNIFYFPGAFLRLFSSAGRFILYQNKFIISHSTTIIDILQTNTISFNCNSNVFLSESLASYQNYAPYHISIIDQRESSILANNIFMSLSVESSILYVQANNFPYALILSNNSFISNKGTQATLLSYNKFIDISKSTSEATVENNVFIKNKADTTSLQYSGYGGAVKIISPEFSVQITKMSANYFINNQADIAGGAIYFNWNPPFFITQNFFKGNFAQKLNHIYGFPVKVAFLENNKLKKDYVYEFEHQTIPKNGSSRLSWTGFPSGINTENSFSFVLLDQYDQIQYADSSSFLFVNSKATTSANIDSENSALKAQIKNGVYTFDFLYFKYNIHKRLLVEFISSAITDRTNFLVPNIISGIEVEISFRNCLNGEVLLPDSTCTSCIRGFWLPIETDNNPGPCTICDPSMLLCYGSSNFGPLPGHWLFNSTSDIPLRCPFPEACLGNNISSSELDYNGHCAEGYKGNLCGQCEIGFGKFGNGKVCHNCSDSWYILKLVVIAIIYPMFFGNLILRIRKVTYDKKIIFLNKRVVLVRIMINYLQLMFIIKSISLEWPEILETLFWGFGEIIFSIDYLLTNECLLNSLKSSSNITNYQFILSQLNVLIFVSLTIFYILILKGKRLKINSSKIKSRIISAIIVLFYLIYPKLLINSFNMLACLNLYRVDHPIYFLKIDWDYQCWTAEHLAWGVYLNLPFMIVWLGLLPFLLLKIYTKIKGKMAKSILSRKYYFLWAGYRHKKYYWELVLFLRKILSVFILIFSILLSRLLQGIFLLALIITYTVLQKIMHPYELKSLDRIERYSLFSLLASNFMVVYLQPLGSGKFDFLKEGIIYLVIIMNFIYLITWINEYFDGILKIKKFCIKRFKFNWRSKTRKKYKIRLFNTGKKKPMKL